MLVSQEQLDRLKWRQVLTALGTLSIVLLGSIALSFYAEQFGQPTRSGGSLAP
ncbi:MAG: hypothetical protein IPO35_00545 [Uliginosibacterium sp.]|nr:hypothetical protein [Uliginosibacterium sp.]